MDFDLNTLNDVNNFGKEINNLSNNNKAENT